VAYATAGWENTLFKTTDGGGHWSPIHSSAGELALDPLPRSAREVLPEKCQCLPGGTWSSAAKLLHEALPECGDCRLSALSERSST